MLTLNRLDRRDRGALVAQIAGGEALPGEVVDQIVDRTDGVPFFIEELTKSILESGVPLVGIPATLHDSLMARLDRLAPVRLVAQIGAAIGRQFPYVLLRAISDLPEDELRAALARLVASELVFQGGTPPEAVYTFKHALVQDAAHDSLLRSSRRQLHAQIATALETQSPELMENQPELFAQHSAEAGLVEKSVVYWGKAGHRSATRSAMAEAAAQFQKALDQLALLPDEPNRQRQELELCSSLGPVLQALKGHAAPETGRAYARSREPVGTALLPTGIPSYSIWGVSLSQVPRRIGIGIAPGRGSAASEPAAQRFHRARSGPPRIRSRPDGCRQVCLIAVPFGSSDCAIRSNRTSLACSPGRK
ncbi:MAG: hypothetical protein JO122_19480 [Acetobacteraceae bacterium]|nr:hypothetical protein [Acetobacteraceae bacterium]